MEAEPAKATDPLSQLVAAVGKTTIELGNVRRELADERDTRERNDSQNAKVTRRLSRLTVFDICATSIIAILGLITGNLLVSHNADVAAQKRRDVAAAHVRAVQQCHTTNEARAGIRGAFDTEDQIWHSLIPNPPTAAQTAAIAKIDSQFAAAKAGIPDQDCTKVP